MCSSIIIIIIIIIVACRDPLLGNDSEQTTKQRPLLGNRFLISISWTTTGPVFSTRSMPRCYKQDSWNNESVVEY
jgi:hypothetical protein